ncbi:hypothetical protein K7X08_002412 [Anisodus acutangulus]|uniref:EF-hand domain-containing protein n=1 Tax=Anisodus acutangulus TaxID=402998 RepID=A0A9Q1R792_9SOLA|nr:hypothetical protein K7X08_002412 [Anisodus acutangulus]
MVSAGKLKSATKDFETPIGAGKGTIEQVTGIPKLTPPADLNPTPQLTPIIEVENLERRADIEQWVGNPGKEKGKDAEVRVPNVPEAPPQIKQTQTQGQTQTQVQEKNIQKQTSGTQYTQQQRVTHIPILYITPMARGSTGASSSKTKSMKIERGSVKCGLGQACSSFDKKFVFLVGMSTLNDKYIQRMFDKLDEDGDGLVSLDELKGLLDKIGACMGLDKLQSLVGKTSLNYIDFLFFYEAMVKKNNEEKRSQEDNIDDNLEDLVEAFKVFDLNGDGFISCEELQKVLSRLGLWDEKEGSDCKNMIHMYDTNLDGVLDFEEFKNMMLVSNYEDIPL